MNGLSEPRIFAAAVEGTVVLAVLLVIGGCI